MNGEEENAKSEPSSSRSNGRDDYPCELRSRESELLGKRPQTAGEDPCFRVGLALSGGGLRSATFSLGVAQALARRKLLDKIDALSTVSGGGYTGSMISRLFRRRTVESVADVERAILPKCEDDEASREGREESRETIESGTVFRWLQDNGHHLAPNGGGDLLLGGTVILRNWVSVQIVLVVLFLTAFVLMQLIRHLGELLADDAAWLRNAFKWLNCLVPESLWWSPWFLAAILPLAASVLFGLLYWLIPCRKKAALAGLHGLKWGHRLSVCLMCALVVFAVVTGRRLSTASGRPRTCSCRLASMSCWRP